MNGLRAIDHNGFTPDPEPLDASAFDEQLASAREGFAKAQADLISKAVQIAYEIGRLRGIVEERNRERM